MTIHVPAWMQGGSYTADTDRAVIQALLGGSPNQALTNGTLHSADLAVTQTGTASMVLDVAAGAAVINGTDATGQGPYIFVNDAQATVTIATADATHGRIDLVVARVKDAEFAGALTVGTIEPVTGTPASIPVAPTAPTNTIILAQIEVDANATSITTAKITDQRVKFARLSQLRGVPVCSVTEAGAYSFTTTLTVLKFDTPATDSHSAFSTSTGQYTVPEEGIYLVTADVFAAATAGNATVFVQKNGSTIGEGRTVTGSANLPVAVTCFANCQAGDLLDIAIQGSTTIAGVTGTQTRLDIVKISSLR